MEFVKRNSLPVDLKIYSSDPLLSFTSYFNVNETDSRMLTTDELMNKIEECQEQITHFRRENIFLDRCFERINNSTVLQIPQRALKRPQRNTERWSRLPPIQRRWSDGHSDLSLSQGHSLWIHAIRTASVNLKLQKKKYLLAMQELEYMHSDWQREKKNTEELLKSLENRFESISNDEQNETFLNHTLKITIDNLILALSREKFRKDDNMQHAEHFLEAIREETIDRSKAISLLKIDNSNKKRNMHRLNEQIKSLDVFLQTVDEISLKYVQVTKSEGFSRYEQLEKETQEERPSLHALLRKVEEYKSMIHLDEKQKESDEKNTRQAQENLAKLQRRIDLIETEIRNLSKENRFLSERISACQQKTSILDHVLIHQKGAELERSIKFWTNRVQIAESVLSQLKRRNPSSSTMVKIQENTFQSGTAVLIE